VVEWKQAQKLAENEARVRAAQRHTIRRQRLTEELSKVRDKNLYLYTRIYVYIYMYTYVYIYIHMYIFVYVNI